MKVEELLKYSDFNSGIMIRIYEYNDFLDKYEEICGFYGYDYTNILIDDDILNSNINCYDISYSFITTYFNIYLE